ncbi:MAG TPA: polysaccharide biosynthesis/export family protein [Longimicrobiales bacterium]|nr:polysaccharide biosynthesis/export family protein [Longimicrobiales bacterium]
MTDFAAMTRARPAAVRWAGIAAFALFTGCASSGSQQSIETLPTQAAAEDSARAEALNRRIQAAAVRDSASRAVPDLNTEYRIGSNDEVEISVFGAAEFSGTHRVEDSGEIAIPLLGAVTAAGKTPRELETHLQDRLRETYMRDPHVSVQVLEIQSQGVSVVGAVGAPGVYQVSGSKTLLEVLAMAQGLSEQAGNAVFVMRPSKATAQPPELTADGGLAEPLDGGDAHVIEVDLGALLESGDASQNVVVQPGDIVQVRPAGLVYVVGEVNRPGGFTIPAGQPLTVLQALALAEGLGSTAAASRSVIVRELAAGDRMEIPVDLDAVLNGNQPPPTLAARDVLFVPNNTAKAVALGVVNGLVRMVTLRGLFY